MSGAINTSIGGVALGLSLSGGRSGSNLVPLERMRVKIVKELAEGGFGTIYLAEAEAEAETVVSDKGSSNSSGFGSSSGSSSSRLFALKQMLCQSREQEEDATRELQCLQRLTREKAENCIALLDHCIQTQEGRSGQNRSSASTTNYKTFMLLFPLCSRGSVWSVIESGMSSSGSSWPFSEAMALKITLGIAKALSHLHDRCGWSHRDMKPHNVLLGGKDGSEPFLTDFGLVAMAKVVVTSRSQALALEDEAAVKTSAAYRY